MKGTKGSTPAIIVALLAIEKDRGAWGRMLVSLRGKESIKTGKCITLFIAAAGNTDCVVHLNAMGSAGKLQNPFY